jgi:hypothetical protein
MVTPGSQLKVEIVNEPVGVGVSVGSGVYVGWGV